MPLLNRHATKMLATIFLTSIAILQSTEKNIDEKNLQEKSDSSFYADIENEKSQYLTNSNLQTDDNKIKKATTTQLAEFSKKKIANIFFNGNYNIETSVLLDYIPFAVGDVFDPILTRSLIKKMWEIGHYRQVCINIEDISDDLINLHILFTEETRVTDISFEGNKNLTEKEIKKKVDFSSLTLTNKNELKKIARSIKNIYVEKGINLLI